MKKLILLELIFGLIIATILNNFVSIVVIAQEITIYDSVIKEDYAALKVDITFPVIQGLKNKQIEKNINQTIQQDIFNFKNELWIESEEYLKLSDNEKWEIGKYEASTYYEVHYQKNDILSFSIFYYRYTLGAHGSVWQKAYNLNLITGEIISLLDIFRGKKDYVEFINREIKRQIQLNLEEYFDRGAVFQSISSNQPFYLVEDDVVIYFGLYEIAPYASGIKYFLVPFAWLETYLK